MLASPGNQVGEVFGMSYEGSTESHEVRSKMPETVERIV
jgi:hypothetical protein